MPALSPKAEIFAISAFLIEAQDGKIQMLAEQYGGIRETLDAHTRVLESHTQMIGNLVVDVTFIKTTLEKKAGKKEVAALEHRIVVLEKGV